MPRATLQPARILDAAGTTDAAGLRDALADSKAEVSEWDSAGVVVEVTPDRLDLLCESGLAREAAGRMGAASGAELRTVAAGPDGLTIVARKSVAPLRPAIAAVVVRAPDGRPLDDGLLDEAVRYQELLHATVGGQRAWASLGIYPVEGVRPPVTYSLEPIEDVSFVPLDGDAAVGASAFFTSHPMAVQFGALGRSGDRCLTLRDAGGQVLSLPPVLNARPAGEAKPGASALLLESTGTRSARVADAVGLLAGVFAARGWSVQHVPVRSRTGAGPVGRLDRLRRLRLSARELAHVTGMDITTADAAHLLGRARLDAHPSDRGVRVGVPPWRPDLLTPVDLVEDLTVARGLRPQDGSVPSSHLAGRRLPESGFHAEVEALILGLGFQPLHTPVLVGRDVVERTGRTGAIEVANPVSEQYSRIRDALLPSMVGALERNTRRAYPQRFGEVGPVVLRASEEESGAVTRMHAVLVVASEAAGFAEAAGLADYLMSRLGARGVREPVDVPGTIPGRAARLRLAGVAVGELGELTPRLLRASGVPVPAVFAELDLAALWPLFRRPAERGEGSAP